MKKIITLVVSLIAIQQFAKAQIPPNTCGIKYSYDDAGNRVKREYFCSNPFAGKTDLRARDAQPINALYPNPTTGKFSITFSHALKQTPIELTDANGKVMMRFFGNGTKVDFDISSFAAGIYFLQIGTDKNIIRQKVVKE